MPAPGTSLPHGQSVSLQAALAFHESPESSPESAVTVETLAQAARRALVAGAAPAAWLLADAALRLAPAAAGMLLVRAGALSALDAPARAQTDLTEAIALEPGFRAGNEAALRLGDDGLRLRAIRNLLGIDGAIPTALSAAFAAGYASVVRLETDDAALCGTLWWQGAQPALTVAFEGAPVPLVIGDVRAEGAGHRGEWRCAWPPGAMAARVEAGPAALVEPGVLHRPLRLPPPRPESEHAGQRGVLILIPVYDDVPATRTCLESLAAAQISIPHRILVIEDCPPDPAMAPMLAEVVARHGFARLANAQNLGFAHTINRGLAMRAPGEDVLLLNADTVVPKGAVEALCAVLRAEPDIGTVTPLSNNGEDTSFPVRFRVNPLPSREGVQRWHDCATRVHGARAIDLVNGVGFCLAVRAEVVARLGGLPLHFERGYFEDVAYCLEAAAAGFRNVCAPGVFVGHHGTLSFKAEKKALVRRNLTRLRALFPDYDARSDAFVAQDPLRPALCDLERAMLAEELPEWLAIVPAETPLALAGLAVNAAFPSARALFLVIDREDWARGDAAWLLRLRGADGAAPQSIDVLVNAADLAAALAAEKARLGAPRTLLVDPWRLPHAAGVGALGAEIWLALSHPPAELPATAPPPGGIIDLSATGGLTAEAMGAPAARSTLAAAPTHWPPPLAASRRLAVFATGPSLAEAEARMLGAGEFADILAEALRVHAPGWEAVIFSSAGPPRLLANLIAIRAAGADEIARWIADFGIAAAFLPARFYGAADPWGAALQGAGYPLALFGTDDRAGQGRLTIVRGTSTAAAARRLAQWLASLEAA